MSFADKNNRAPKIRPQSIDQVLDRLDRLDDVEAGHLRAMLRDEATWPSADVVDALHDEGYRVFEDTSADGHGYVFETSQNQPVHVSRGLAVLVEEWASGVEYVVDDMGEDG